MDSSDNTMLNSIAGSEFENQIESFACLKFTESIIVCSILIIESYLEQSLLGQRIFMTLIGVYGVIGCSICYTFPFKRKEELPPVTKEVLELELSTSQLI